MKRFDFRLERVRQWREKQVSLEEAALERILGDRRLIEARLAALEQEAAASAGLVKAERALELYELRAMDDFRRFAIAQRAVLARLTAECDERVRLQRVKLVDAQRKAELLNQLKERRWKKWNRDLAKEIEEQAGEIYLAKWSGEHRQARRAE